MFYIAVLDVVNATLCFRQMCFLCFSKVFFRLLVNYLDILVFRLIYLSYHKHLYKCLCIHTHILKHKNMLVSVCDSLYILAFLEFILKLKQ